MTRSRSLLRALSTEPATAPQLSSGSGSAGCYTRRPRAAKATTMHAPRVPPRPPTRNTGLQTTPRVSERRLRVRGHETTRKTLTGGPCLRSRGGGSVTGRSLYPRAGALRCLAVAVVPPSPALGLVTAAAPPSSCRPKVAYQHPTRTALETKHKRYAPTPRQTRAVPAPQAAADPSSCISSLHARATPARPARSCACRP